MENFNEQLNVWLEAVKAKFQNDYSQFEIDPNGKKYIRIVEINGGQKSVYVFVEKATGDIYKASSWKAPAKHARGNILDLNLNGLTQFGAVYLR